MISSKINRTVHKGIKLPATQLNAPVIKQEINLAGPSLNSSLK